MLLFIVIIIIVIIVLQLFKNYGLENSFFCPPPTTPRTVWVICGLATKRLSYVAWPIEQVSKQNVVRSLSFYLGDSYQYCFDIFRDMECKYAKTFAMQSFSLVLFFRLLFWPDHCL